MIAGNRQTKKYESSAHVFFNGFFLHSVQTALVYNSDSYYWMFAWVRSHFACNFIKWLLHPRKNPPEHIFQDSLDFDREWKFGPQKHLNDTFWGTH